MAVWQATVAWGDHIVKWRCLGMLALVPFLPVAISANPIPIPADGAIIEKIQIQIAHSSDGLHAGYLGRFHYESRYGEWQIPVKILFPLPPTATNITVKQNETNLDWHWTTDTYATALPEWPTIPMLEWDWPTTATTEEFSVHYEHDLIERGSEHIFFYAMGVWKFYDSYYDNFEWYYSDRSVDFDIDIPEDMVITWVHADDQPYAYSLIDSRATINVESKMHPLRMNLIISLEPQPQDFRIAGFSPASYGTLFRATSRVEPLVFTFTRDMGNSLVTTDSLKLIFSRFDNVFTASDFEVPITSLETLTSTTLQFMPLHPLQVGWYQVRLDGDAIQDGEGHALDAEFSGEYPTGDGSPGGDYLCSFRVRSLSSDAAASMWRLYD